MASQPQNLLIQGGVVVDGAGAPAVRADVRVRAGLIAEVGPGLEAAADETVFEARGCQVTPGLIESHTHFDGTMWWQPGLEPLPGCGVTTVVMGKTVASPWRRCMRTRRCAPRW